MSMEVIRTTITVDRKVWMEFEHEVIERFGTSGQRKEAIEEALKEWTRKSGKKKQ